MTCCQAQLDLTNSYLLWSRSLQARPDKCFAAALGFDKAGHFGPINPNLSIGGTKINNLGNADFKYLGKYLNMRSSEVNCRKLTMETLESLLETIDTTPLMASTKIWLYHHFVTTKVGWSLLINDLCLSFVKELQAAATRSLKRWVGLPRCANTSILFVGGPRQCGLKVRNLVTVWKQQQSIKLNLLEASADKRCQFLAKSISDRQSNWARKFAPAREAQIAKTVVLANSERAAPFHPTVTTDPPLSPRSTRKRVNQYIHDIDVAEQLEHLRTLQVQGKWLQWSERMHQDLSWQQLIYNWSDAELRFALQATTDTAPSATNLRRWGVANIDPACCLCGKPATSRHVLNACAVALQQGRYTWRHDSVLSVICHHLHKFWELPATQRAVEVTMASRSNRFIRFVPAGTTLPLQSHQRRPLSSQTLLLQANDWEFLFDLDEQLQFPPEVAVTSLRPDVVILSRSTKTVIMLELTVPLEDRSHLAYDRKSSKYSALVTACEESGFKAHLFPIEVGCLGYSPHSLLHCLEALGLPKSTARQLRTECSRVARRCSYIIFLRRGIKPWQEMSRLY